MFEVFRGKVRVAYTEHEGCIPPKETLRQMKAAGYRFVKDGKPWNGGSDGKDRLRVGAGEAD